MKKLLLLCAAAMTSMCFNTAAAQFIMSPAAKAPQTTVERLENTVTSESSAGLEFGYCGDDIIGLGTGSLNEIGACIQIPGSTAASYQGNRITKVKIGFGNIEETTKVMVFVAKRLNGMYNYKEEYELAPVELTADGEGEWREFELSEAYPITSTGFYVGYMVTPSSVQDYPLGVDGVGPSNSYGNRIYSGSWGTLVDAGFDCNVCIRVVIEGDNLPQDDVALTSVYAPAYAKPGEPFEFVGNVENKGVKEVSSLEVTYQLGDMAPVVKTLDAEIATNGKYQFSISDAVYNGAAGVGIPLTATVTKVNGVDDSTPDNNTVTTSFWSGNTSYERAVVVEEATGTGCGYCPRGIAGLKYMKETYPDYFIGIAVHFSDFGPDPMETESYRKLPYSGLPWSNINRVYMGVDPNAEYLEMYYNAERSIPAFAQVDFKNVAFNADSTKMTVDTRSEFAINVAEADYRLAFVVLENQVGPYNQRNYYAGGGSGPMDGWEWKSDPVSTMYDDVARDIFEYDGLRGSVPAEITAGEVYEYSYDVDLRNVANANNIEIVAMLIDGATGEILNAKKLNEKQIAGITAPEFNFDENAPVVFYNLQGVQISNENLVPGIYVKRQGNKAEKVVIR